MSKIIVIERRGIEGLENVGQARVYVSYIRAGTYSRVMFIDELRNVSTSIPAGEIKWDDVISELEKEKVIRVIDGSIVVDRNFTRTVTVDRYEKKPIERVITRTISTHVGILRWSTNKYRGEDRYRRVKELLVYYTPDNPKMVDDKDIQIEVFRALLECTPIMRKWEFGVDSVINPESGWGYPYSPNANSGKAVFEVAKTTAEYDDGFWEYNDYNIEEFIEGKEMMDTGELSLEDLKLRALGAREATEGDVSRGRAKFVGQIIGGGESGLIDAEDCLNFLRVRLNLPSFETVFKE